MDDRELQAIRRLRDDASAPADEVAAARRALQVAIDDEIARGSAPAASPARRRSFRLPRLVTRPAFATAMAILALVLGFTLVAQLVRPVAAVAALTDLASVAESIDPLVVPAGSAVYTRSVRSDLVQVPAEDVPGAPGTVVSFLLPQVREVWVTPTGERRLEVTAGEPVFFDDATREAFVAAGLAADYGVGVTEVTAFAPPEVDVDPGALPLEPAAMRDALVALASDVGGGDPAVAVFDIGGALLRESTASPETRGAVIRALATFGDRLVIVERTDDLLEVSVSFSSGVSTLVHSLVFDPDTASLVGESVVVSDADPAFGVPDGTALETATYSVPAVVPFAPASA